ncbi:MAG: hypothetical protein SGI72_17975 [Planctomycetota bacterium]|nr:hypothetical protein [Planctomycetota bacterium]
MILRLLTALFFLSLSTAQVLAQAPDAPNLSRLLVDWNQKHGGNWRVVPDEGTGFLQMLWGGRADSRTRAVVDEDYFTLAREALRETYAMHGIDDATLEPVSTLHLPLAMIGSTDKMTVRFRQTVGGVPVEDGFVNALFDMQGRLLSIQSVGMPHVAGFDVRPSIDADRATRAAIAAFRAQSGVLETGFGAAQLVVDQDFDGEQRLARLAWKIDVRSEAEGFDPVGFEWFVDARTAAAYKSEASVHFFDVSGTVTGSASPGGIADIASNAATQQPMRFLKVTSGAVTTFTDTTGNFTLPGLTAPISVTVDYSGSFTNVNNAAGSDYSLTTVLNAATGNVIQMAPTPTEVTTAQANAHRAILLVRDFIKTTNPSDTRADFVSLHSVNQAGSCNASWTGGQTNYYLAGGGCANFAFGTIVAHEFGHWLNALYGTNNGPDGMGEGNADVWGCYTFDSVLNGQGAYGSSGSFVRSGNNTRSFCGDASGGCYGEVHNDGEVWMGAAWKIRNRLNTAYGNTIGDQIANSIFLGWMNGYNQTQIRTVIETQWLTLDDDDGNINSGTPHYTHIDLGFKDQGFPGVTLFQVTVDTLTVLPDTTNQTTNYGVSARIIANQNPPIATAQIKYRLNGGTFQTVNMTAGANNMYSAAIPAQLGRTKIEYYVTATNSVASSNVAPQSAPGVPVQFDVGIPHVIASYTFDLASDDQGFTHGGTADEWQRGDPNGKVGTGWADPGSSFSPIQAWGTDLGATTAGSYSANGNNWLRTPVLNCTGAVNTRLRFNRWLSVQGSASDQARVRVNGTQVFINPTTNLNDGSWLAQEIDISAIADNNASVTIEWALQSNTTTQYGGWNLDDVEVLWVEGLPIPCAAEQHYCTGAVNSTGFGALLFTEGTPNISTNNLRLYAQGLPVGTAGIFFYGPNATQIPFGNGFICVTGATYRLPVVFADFFGIATYPINYANLPNPIVAGDVWRFQFWYRDNVNGNPGFNLSEGLAVTFCP